MSVPMEIKIRIDPRFQLQHNCAALNLMLFPRLHYCTTAILFATALLSEACKSIEIGSAKKGQRVDLSLCLTVNFAAILLSF